MHSDPKECLYCTNNYGNLMILIAELSVSRVFLFKEQTYHGRCLVSYNGHVNDLNELSDEERNAFMADVARTTRAMQKVFNPEKINYGAYSDKLSHLHFHLAPKYVDGPDYGGKSKLPSKSFGTGTNSPSPSHEANNHLSKESFKPKDSILLSPLMEFYNF